MVRENNQSITDAEIDKCLESDFAIWFKQYVSDFAMSYMYACIYIYSYYL